MMCSTMKFAANEVNTMPSTITESSSEMGCKGHPLTSCNKFQLSIWTIYCWVYPIIDHYETSFFVLGFPHDHTINYEFWDGFPTLSHFYSMIKHDRPQITAGNLKAWALNQVLKHHTRRQNDCKWGRAYFLLPASQCLIEETACSTAVSRCARLQISALPPKLRLLEQTSRSWRITPGDAKRTNALTPWVFERLCQLCLRWIEALNK